MLYHIYTYNRIIQTWVLNSQSLSYNSFHSHASFPSLAFVEPVVIGRDWIHQAILVDEPKKALADLDIYQVSMKRVISKEIITKDAKLKIPGRK